MDYDYLSPLERDEARREWERARRQATGGLLAIFNQPQHEALLPFEDVRSRLRLFQSAYKGLQYVPLDKIIGSVDRYQDFTREFLPLVDEDAYRWQRVATLQRIQGLPPIELYKIGDAYFVKDGNHRVSVMRQLGAKSIEAHVWEYYTPVPVTAADDFDDIIVKAEYLDFMEKTQLDELRPDSGIRCTAPGMYPELEFQIEMYRRNLSLIDGYDVSFEDAAVIWYDMVYSLAADTIEEMGLLKHFPGRTVTDLYIWVYDHRQELAAELGHKVSTKDAATDLIKSERETRHGPVQTVMQQLANGVEHIIDALSGEADVAAVRGVSPAVLRSEAEVAEAVETVTPLSALIGQMRAIPPALAYPRQGRTAWREWRTTLGAKLYELLGVTPRDGALCAPPTVEIGERVNVKGVVRESLILVMDDGLRVPAYLLTPAKLGAKKAPALLIYPGQGTIQQTAGMQNSYHNGNALALAQAGFVTLTLEGRGFGRLGQVDYAKLDAVARLIGRTWAGLVVEDGLRALDYLQTRPEVDPERLGVAGNTVAGALTLYTAALDERVTACVISNYLVRFDDIPADGPRYRRLSVPNLRRCAEAGDIGALIAPRPALFVQSEGALDQNYATFHQVRLPYELLRVPDRLRHEKAGPGRGFDNGVAIRWFTRWLVEEEAMELLRNPYDPD